ncbi:BMP family lipoprotein [Halalkalibacter akibai]|uniref:Unspecified monosaccharide ABC transport system n=1 Tax=Halalkalibacter akibai (strain ATCC 43226 / DSM 21942 / CIP 109018 / JCM 9157 / 1139) TaxID=1236973 RepID=W4QX96_HALA3|nr:BMP family protein [Halalkalibacter akibai]GAE36273.1 unspecified monosaccharide ABC transport system [Halalkalibacter akibai JCM 9157]
MKKWLRTLTMTAAAVMTLAACGTADETPPATEDAAPGEDTEQAVEATDFTVGMVTDVGGIDDKSFNQSAWEGLSQFGQEVGLEEGTGYRYVQSGSLADFEPNLRNLVREDVELVWGIGYLMADAVRTIAEQVEDAQIAIVDSVVTDDEGQPLPNVANITFKEHEGSFLVGVAAGLQTQGNKVGFVGGVEGALIKKFENGFKAGVKSVNPDAEIIVQYAESFNDADRGQQIANTMYSQGVDVIYQAAGGTGNGVFTEAINRARNGEAVWVVGVDRDQHEEGIFGDDNQSVTLTSMVKRVDRAVYLVSERTMSGDFPGGEILEYGLEDEAVGIAPTTDNLTDESVQAVESYFGQIQAGEIAVPQTDEEYEEFLSSL